MLYEWVVQAMQAVLTLVYAAVGWTVLKRRPDGPGRMAATSFSAWWVMLAVVNLSGAVSFLVTAAEAWTVPAYVAYTQMVLLLIVAALACLMYYLLYLFTGRRWAWMPIAAAYAGYYLAILVYLAYASPQAIETSGGGTRLVYARDLSGHWSTTLLGGLLLGPPLLGAMAYVSLLWRVRGRTQRFRIATIGGAFVLWFGVTFVAGQVSDVGDEPWWRVVSALLALFASLAVLAAFRPPAWLRHRFGIAGFGEA